MRISNNDNDSEYSVSSKIVLAALINLKKTEYY